MPWTEASSMSLRAEFTALANVEGANVPALCLRIEVSAPAAYKWLQHSRARARRGWLMHLGGRGVLPPPARPRWSPASSRCVSGTQRCAEAANQADCPGREGSAGG
jgi:hypothetical protein